MTLAMVSRTELDRIAKDLWMLSKERALYYSPEVTWEQVVAQNPEVANWFRVKAGQVA